MIYGRNTHKVELIFPKDKAKGYYCYRAVMNLDVEKKVPLKVRIYDWEDNLVERNGHEELKLNPGLTRPTLIQKTGVKSSNVLNSMKEPQNEDKTYSTS
jgi:hypothetical protein